MISPATIDQAARLLMAAAPAGSRVILFGSLARGAGSPTSDIDFLVVEPSVTSVHREAVRLRQALRALRVPVDVVVTSAARFEYWRATPNTLAHAAATHGRVYESVA